MTKQVTLFSIKPVFLPSELASAGTSRLTFTITHPLKLTLPPAHPDGSSPLPRDEDLYHEHTEENYEFLPRR